MSYGIDEKEQILFERELERLSEKRSGVLGGRLEPDDSLPDYFFKQKTKQQQKQKQPAATKIEPETNIAKVVDPYLLPPIPQIRKPILRPGGPASPPSSLLKPGKNPASSAYGKPEVRVKQPAISKGKLPKVTFPEPKIPQAKPLKINIPIKKPDLAKIKVDVPKVKLPKVGLPSLEKPKSPALQITPSKIKIVPKEPVVNRVKVAPFQLDTPPSGLVSKEKFILKIDKNYVLKMATNGRYYKQSIKNPNEINWIKFKDAYEILKRAAKQQDYTSAGQQKQKLQKTGTGDVPEEPSNKLQQNIAKAKKTQTVGKPESSIKTGISQSGEKVVDFKKAQQAKLDAMAKKQLEIDAEAKRLQTQIDKQAKTLRGANNVEFTDSQGVKHKVPKKTWGTKIRSGIRPGMSISGNIIGIVGFALANAEAAHAWNKKVSEDQKKLSDTDVKTLLTPMQFSGGADNTPLSQPVPFTTPKNNMFRIFTDANPEQSQELRNSWQNMSIKDRNSLEFTDNLVKDNIVRMMLPDGSVQDIRSRRVFDLYNQPGTVMQIIPTYEYEGHPDFGTKRKKIQRNKIGTSGITTYYIGGERTTPTGIYHDVSAEEKPGGTKIDDNGNELYIPLDSELNYYKLAGIDIPSDWYVPNETAQQEKPPVTVDDGVDTTRKEDFVDRGEVTVDEDEIKNVINSTTKTRGAPNTKENYEALMIDLAQKSGVDIKLLKTLGATESQVSPNNLTKWKYRGDQNMGKEGSFGIFHVRWGITYPGAVNDYNNEFDTKHTWRSIATDPFLAATIGAWYFKTLLDRYNNVSDAYAHYTSGSATSSEGKKNAERFMRNYKMFESRNFSKKSAILEGMSKVNI
tara:strand:+ start:714 stop:3269 length:2556 start_codon:yes stop_codon:yes gene_type:complete